MPSLPGNAPYDSLATVTQLVRTYLGDFIQNLNPNLAGVVSTNGVTVTLVSGSPFSVLMNDLQITINNIVYTILTVTSTSSLILTATAGVQANVAYTAIISTGDIFADSQNYVLPTINAAWREVQKKLAMKGHPRMRNEVDLLNLPVVTNLDPISQQYITWTGFFDGTNLKPTPLLPQDFISPFRIWERQSGMTVKFNPMQPAGDSLWSCNKGSWNKYFDWREDAIYFPGALLLTDMRISYAAFLADIVVAPTGFSGTPVPIMRVADPLAYYACAIFVAPRGGEDLVATFSGKGDTALAQITNAHAKLQQRASFHRKAWGERGRRNSYGR